MGEEIDSSSSFFFVSVKRGLDLEFPKKKLAFIGGLAEFRSPLSDSLWGVIEAFYSIPRFYSGLGDMVALILSFTICLCGGRRDLALL